MNGMNRPRLTGVAGIALIAIDGLIHFSLFPEYFEYASYLDLLFLANTFGSALSALGINLGTRWGWTLGTLTSGGALVLYVVSRLFGLPGLPESEREWLDGVADKYVYRSKLPPRLYQPSPLPLPGR